MVFNKEKVQAIEPMSEFEDLVRNNFINCFKFITVTNWLHRKEGKGAVRMVRIQDQN